MSAGKINQKEYLKKYLSGDLSGQHKKKKKKKDKATVSKATVTIVDDDIDLSQLANATEQDLENYNLGEDLPQIAGIIDERSADVIAKEDYGSSKKWKTLGNDGADSMGKKTKNYSCDRLDASPPRRSKRAQRSPDASPLRRNKSRDSSPPRRNRSRDASPPRRRNKSRSKSRDVSPSRQGRRRCPDASPPRRQQSNRNASPLRRRRSQDSTPPKRNASRDSSPLRRKRSRDSSPPRRRNRSRNASPPRRRYKSRSKSRDVSPSRRGIRRCSDASPPRRQQSNRDASSLRRRRSRDSTPPKRNASRDSSPLRRKRSRDASPPRRRKRSRDSSPPRRIISRDASPHRRDRSSDASPKQNQCTLNVTPSNRAKQSPNKSPPRQTNTKMMETLEGKKAGLQDATALREENELIRRREDDMFRRMAEKQKNDDSNTVRDRKTGRRAKYHKETEKDREQKKRDAVRKEVYDRWGAGLKQIEDYQQRVATETHEMSKPMARYADDNDLEDYLRNQCRDGDPMAKYMQKKTTEKQSQPHKPVYQGSFPENRFNIRPGYRWDGLDRSNGYEKKWFDQLNQKKAVEEEAYKYSVEDM